MEEKKYLKRKEKALKEGNREVLAQTCNHLGDFYNQQGRYQCAVKEYEEEAILYSKLGKQLEMAKAHRMVGEMYMLLSDFDNAKSQINTYLKIVKKLQNKVEEQRAFATLGRAHLLHGQALSETTASSSINELRQAERAFLKSLLLTKELTGQISKLEQLDMQARCYLNIGVVKEHMEDFEESIANMEKALKISKSNDIFELTHTCYVSMSLLYHCKKNDPTSALRFCNLALEAAKRLQQKVKKICETLIIKSEILVKAGDFASAKQILTKAYKKNTPDENDRQAIEKSLRIVVKICRTLDELVTTSSIDYEKRKHLYEKLGDYCCNLFNYAKALEYYGKMLECAELNNEAGKSLIPIYVSLYQTYKDNNQYDEALKYLWKEFDLNKDVPKEAFSTLCTIAEVCEMQKQSFWTIQDIYQKAKEQAMLAGDKQNKLEKIVYARLRKLQLKHNMNVLAEELAQEATSRGIDIKSLEDDSDTESENVNSENAAPDSDEDICLEDLTDSDTSDLDETEKPRPHRVTRGTRSLTIKRNNKGETQLHQACIAGNIELVRRLIDQGHVVNVRDHAGWLPLHEACNHGFRDIVELLLDRGASVAINDKGGTSCDGITPLYDACSNGFFDVIELLLERGADATVKTDFGDTCLSSLDKWRHSATLTEGDQAQYEQVRSKLIKTLSKVGICSSQSVKPLTNANVSYSRKDHYKKSDQGLLTDDESSNNTDEEENILPTSSSRLNRSLDKCRTKSPVSAGTVYKNAIEQLKRPLHRQNSSESEMEVGLVTKKHKRGGYMDIEDVDDDSWLIDDIGPDKKRRRFHTTPTKQLRQAIKSPTKDNYVNESNSSRWSRESISPDNDAFQVLQDAATGTSSQQRHKQAKKLSLSRKSSTCSNASGSQTSHRTKPKHQSSLMDSGFCRFRSESPHPYSEDSNDTNTAISIRTEPDSTTASIQLLISPTKSSPIKVQTTQLCLPTTTSFKVKVEDEMLLVPIERKKLNDINMRWLAEEAARRYYNLVGLKPTLRLKTADGFAYEESDLVAVAVEQSMILATVLEWQISPLGQRYEEMCIQLHRDVNKEVLDVLQRAQISNVIHLNDLWLPPIQTEPIFKAVLHQSNLRSLDLSNNFIQNEGCRQLAKALPTLKHLRSLNLSSNLISCDGIEVLLSSASNLNCIEEIILSRNPLRNDCVRIVDRFCSTTAGKSLRKLHLSHCCLTNVYDFDLNFYELVDFDISFNQLKEEALHKILTKLNSSRLQNLNLNYIDAGTKSGCAAFSSRTTERLITFFESGTCEKFRNISLAGWHLSDVDIYKIVLCLSRANDLELFNISDNERLSNSSLHFIFDKVPQLRKLLATNCTRLWDVDNLQRLSQLQNIPNYMSISMGCENAVSDLTQQLSTLWSSLWGDRGKVKKYDNNIILYVNNSDLFHAQSF